MLHLGSVYLIVRDFQKSIAFYTALLQMQPTGINRERWAQYAFEGHCIALFNIDYDVRRVAENRELQGHYSQSYLEWLKNTPITYGNQAVLNFWIEDLNAEIARLQSIGIAPVSPVKYVNIAMPYWMVTLNDPDGNLIEITGRYTQKDEEDSCR